MGVCLIAVTSLLASLLLVALGGGVGGWLRHSVGQWVAEHAGSEFPWGTLVVNTSGALVLGLLAGLLWAPALLTGANLTQVPVWSLVVLGLLGSYTTVSSFSLQTLELMQHGRFDRALLNVLLSVSLSVALAAMGWGLGSLLRGLA